MRRTGFLRLLLFAALAAAPGLCLGYEEQSLLTPDGTMHVLRAGTGIELGITDLSINADSFVIEWAARAQDGTVTTAVLPATVSYQEKRGLQLAFDEPTGKLILIWTENIAPYSQIRVGVLQDGTWTNSALLPTQGISKAYNPMMRITHQTVTQLDANDVSITSTASILSVIWWEEAQYLQARYATVFLDENSGDPSSLAVYDLPKLVGSESAASGYGDIPSGSYLYPTLQTDGFSGAVLASFADLHDQRQKVIRIEFPHFRGKPSEQGNVDWQRRHAPIVSVTVTGPLLRMTPVLDARTDPASAVGTTIGAGYKPTLYWRDGDSLKFSRLDGEDWSPLRSITIDETMSYEAARDLVIGMGLRN